MEINMAWKWWHALLGRSTKSDAPTGTDITGGGISLERLAAKVSELEGMLRHIKSSGDEWSGHKATQAADKQALSEAITSLLGAKPEEVQLWIDALLHEARARQKLAEIERQLASQTEVVDALAAGNQLGEHRDQLIALTNKLQTSADSAFWWKLIHEIRSSTTSMELSWNRGLTEEDRQQPEIAALIKEIEDALAPQSSALATAANKSPPSF
jgi:hypothetical protein